MLYLIITLLALVLTCLILSPVANLVAVGVLTVVFLLLCMITLA